jgi:hypothetical protein
MRMGCHVIVDTANDEETYSEVRPDASPDFAQRGAAATFPLAVTPNLSPHVLLSVGGRALRARLPWEYHTDERISDLHCRARSAQPTFKCEFLFVVIRRKSSRRWAIRTDIGTLRRPG